MAFIGDVAGQPCIDESEFCRGAVLYREPLSDTRVSYPRCDVRWERRLDRERQLALRYPQRPPVDWSPLHAGERWDEDDSGP